MLYIVTRCTNVSTIVYFCALYFKIPYVHKIRTKKKIKNRRVSSIIYLLLYFLKHVEMKYMHTYTSIFMYIYIYIYIYEYINIYFWIYIYRYIYIYGYIYT